jgi:hypothetical protein
LCAVRNKGIPERAEKLGNIQAKICSFELYFQENDLNT